jgi:hypothetical protein
MTRTKRRLFRLSDLARWEWALADTFDAADADEAWALDVIADGQTFASMCRKLIAIS